MRWPTGVRSAGTCCGIKRDGTSDLGVIVLDAPATWAGVFTKNAAAAPPVRWCRDLLGKRVSGIVVNSGNANAGTGADGEQAVQRIAVGAAHALSCASDDVLVASTGPIGARLPVEKIERHLPRAIAEASADTESLAEAILTTDTRLKRASVHVGRAGIVGVAKGAAMLAPNMATMLAFLATDAALAPNSLQSALETAVDRSFNRICVDACESTNDSVFLVATERSEEVDPELFEKSLTQICCDLARQIVADAEGATKFVRILVGGAASDSDAVALGRAVASSVLWRAAVNGGDPNWGRVLAALGTADRSLTVAEVRIRIGDVIVFDGQPTAAIADAAQSMGGRDVVIACEVGRGTGSAEVLTTDLSTTYVELNAGGMS